MATFSELCSDVYSLTNRPDLVAETALAVKAATLKLHQSDFYFKDLYESGIQFPTSDYIQQFDVKAVVPLFRALKFIRRYDPAGNGGTGKAAEYYKILTPGELLDSYGNDRVGVAYAAGAVINIKSANLLQYGIIGVYLNPDLATASFTSWIAVDHPYSIEFEAARVLFKMIGFDEQSAAYEKLAAEQLAEVKISNIQSVGY